MINKMLGASAGGTIRGGHHGFDWSAFLLIVPPNFGGGDGICLPSIVVVAPGDPAGASLWACAGEEHHAGNRMVTSTPAMSFELILFITVSSQVIEQSGSFRVCQVGLCLVGPGNGECLRVGCRHRPVSHETTMVSVAWPDLGSL